MTKQILINVKLQTGKRGDKTDLTGRSPLRRRRCTLDCSVEEEEEEEGEGEGEGEEEEEEEPLAADHLEN